MKRLRRRLSISPSMVVALLALVLALGGTSYAATKLAARSVGSKELKKSAVTRTNLKDNAVNGAKVADDSLTGKDVAEASLGQVALAARALNADRTGTADRATTAANADHAAAVGGLDRVFYRVASGTIGPAAVDPTDPTGSIPVHASATATCDAGHFVVGGGARVDDLDIMGVEQSFPDAGGRAWTAAVANDDTAAGHPFTVYAICVPAGTSG
jgi:hypothetical protein